jgi:hypothetical protein
MNLRAPDLVMISGASEPTMVEATMRDLLGASSDVSLAVARVRLPALRRIVDVLESVDRCRIALARLDLHALDGSARADGADGQALERLLAYARSGRLEVRSAGAVRWDPDFSLFRMRDRRCGTFCLFGAHYLAPPQPELDWPLTCLIARRAAVGRVAAHFESLWNAAHDALGPVMEALEQQLCVSPSFRR